MSSKPAIYGGSPLFDGELNIVSPTLPSLGDISERVADILVSGNLTNNSRYVRQFEEEIGKFCGTRHVVAVANATLGLILALQALDLKGEVIVPSFTFSATVHALIWNGLEPVFVDIDPETYNLDPRLVAERITPATSAILAVHVYGNPCEIEALERLARDRDLRLVFDSAQAFGASYRESRCGSFGDAEVFSFHATKTLATGEGGAVTTNDAALAEWVSQGRNFGNTGDDDCRFAGLNAKMTEFSAILGLNGAPRIDEYIAWRNELATIYKKNLEKVPGLSFQRSTFGSRSSHQFFSVLIDPDEFGMSRDELHQALRRENIITRKYFYPPMHRHRAYRSIANRHTGRLPVTEAVSDNILCLPLCSHMSSEDAEKVAFGIHRLHHFSMKARRKYHAV